MTNFTRVREDTVQSTGDLTRTYFTPAAGDLIVVQFSERSGVGTTPAFINDANGGVWVEIGAEDQNLLDSNSRHSKTVWARKVTAADAAGGSFLITTGDGTTNTHRMTLTVWHPDAPYDFTFVDSKTANSGTADWHNLNSGNTPDIAGSDLFELAFASSRISADRPTAISFSTQTDGLYTDVGGTNTLAHAVAIRATGQAGGIKSATVLSDGTGNEGIVGVAVFSNGAIGGALGQAVETDTAPALGASKSRAVGQAAETATAQPVAASKARTLGLAVETATAGPVAASKAAGVGIAAEADTVQPVTAGKSAATGVAAETDTAAPVAASKARAVAQAAETDTALPVTAGKRAGVGRAVETDTVPPLGGAAAGPLGIAVETDTASPVAASKSRAVGQAAETATVAPVTAGKRAAVGPATETDTAPPVAASKARAVGQAAEAATVAPLTAGRARGVGIALEADTAGPIGAGKARVVGLAVETDTARALVSSALPATPGRTVQRTAVLGRTARTAPLAAHAATGRLAAHAVTGWWRAP